MHQAPGMRASSKRLIRGRLCRFTPMKTTEEPQLPHQMVGSRSRRSLELGYNLHKTVRNTYLREPSPDLL